jgi:RNA polymerase sigma-70 factor, ECF subfamily
MSMMQGCFHGKRSLEEERRPGEVARAVVRAKQGDRAAMRFLYLRYAENVYGYARSIVQNDYDAEDVVQQVFTRVLTAIKSYELRSAPFSAWLLRITHNVAVDHVRRRRPVVDTTQIAIADGHSALESNYLRAVLHDALAELPEVQREIVVLRHVVGFSPGEIAQRLGRSEDSVHGLHHRGRRALQTALANAGAAPAALAA